ncbi:helix-turn-helix transcriptional regulator [Companilactobacillus bobalius]|uniref:WYL domain-containing protein n=2 Tax=Companilactobacillus bobalius TaxID=2801451 RepID=A0A202FE01_9LACO|nr:WYL domain-containing protein [Companilactobacillus bobalius]KAE9557024.1 hypothetical protein ATN92_17300 [Companilactobacillus bobalius]OVE98683.1 hypothetical protein LKACC16343_00840 [Companilactobacillus bobalius]GEO59176.1 WYL domain-containing protein [Companilactobacillus paralimentarius]
MNLTLEIFFLLLENRPMLNREIAERLDTNIRNVQRSIEKIESAFDQNISLSNYFNFKKDGRYHTVSQNLFLKEDEILLLIKILVSSRSLNKRELSHLIDKMVNMSGIENRKLVKASVTSELLSDIYIDDKSDRQKKLWELEQYIFNREKIEFEYTDHERLEKAETKKFEILPVHTFFDNYYFFLTGMEKQTHQYVTYRIDWMDKIEPIRVRLNIEHRERLDHGKEAEHNLYGYMGKRTHIYFEYYGYIGYIKDKFPNCRVIKRLDKPNRFPFSVNLIEIEVNYSDGVKLWLLGETTILRVVKPQAIADDIKKTLYDTYCLYNDDDDDL